MKFLVIAFTLFAATGAAFICNQSDGPPPRHGEQHRGGRQRPEGPPPRDPFLLMFDTDNDDRISEVEITAAASVLRKLDQDGDGSLTHHELPRPPRPGDEHRNGGRDSQQRESRSRPALDGESDAEPGTVLLQGGFQTDRRDNGRPVALIAAALDVKEQVFRDAFSEVRPSRSGPPSDAEASANKKVLMAALSKYGITNDRLDEVSNYYRYRPQDGELWTVVPAKVTAVIKDGKVAGFKIVDGGSGYLTAPKIIVAGHDDVQATATIEFSTTMRENGRVKSIELVKD